MEVHILPRDNSNACLVFRNGYYGHPGTHIDPGGGGWSHEPGAGAGAEQGAGHVAREGSPGTMGHHYQHLQSQAPGPQPAMYPCKMPGGPPRSAGRTTELAVVLTLLNILLFQSCREVGGGRGRGGALPGPRPLCALLGVAGGRGRGRGRAALRSPGGRAPGPAPATPRLRPAQPRCWGPTLRPARPAWSGRGRGRGRGCSTPTLPPLPLDEESIW